MPRIYLDYNATAPLAPEVACAMRAVLETQFGNPSSNHWAGESSRTLVETARRQTADLIRCEPAELIFTSGGTEANSYALMGTFFKSMDSRSLHFIISSIEHPSIHKTCDHLERLGAAVTRVAVNRLGQVDPESVRKAITTDTVLISIMHANNEVGTVQPIQDIAAIAHSHDVLMHTDASQSVGKIPVDVTALGVDLLTIAGHKVYAPQGIGGLYVRSGVRLEPLLRGGGHESGRRAGTENVIEIVGLGAACKLVAGLADSARVLQLRNELWERLSQRFKHDVVLNGHPEDRLPNTLNVSFVGHVGHEILARITDLAASTGSACHEGSHAASSVLSAMGVSESVARGAIRFSLGRGTTLAEIEWVVDQLVLTLRPHGSSGAMSKHAATISWHAP